MFHVDTDGQIQSFYSTAFPLTENPISEGGHWRNGFTNGVDWLDVRTTPGHAFGSNVSPSPPFNDPTAVVAGTWRTVQTVEATVIVPATSAQNQECELRLLTTINANSLTGYEIIWSVTSNNYCEIVRWNGPLNSFTSLTGGSFLSPQRLATGNRIKATVSATGLISMYADYGSGYVFLTSLTDTTFTTGNPGLGFFQHGGSQSTMSDFGASLFTASATS